MHVLKGAQQAKYPQQPDDGNDHHHHIKDTFDLAVHGYISIDQPEDYSDGYQDQQDINNWHMCLVYYPVNLLVLIRQDVTDGGFPFV
jgi:hypothetical protein